METHQVVDFGPGPEDHTQGYPFQGTEEECQDWTAAHAIQVIPHD